MPLTPGAARNLITTTKTPPFWPDNTPRWLLSFLPWVEVDAGVYRVNRATEPAQVMVDYDLDAPNPMTAVQYEDTPPEIELATVETNVEVYTRVADLYSRPFDQLQQQLRLAVQQIKERKERELLVHPRIGLLTLAAPEMRLTAAGAPTPDDLDNLLSLVWKLPAFFVAHPRAIAAFARNCNERGLTLATVQLFGVPFLTWRGVPIVPSNKVPVNEGRAEGAEPAGEGTRGRRESPGRQRPSGRPGGTSSILLMRVGEEQQGVIGLHQAGIGTEDLPSLAVRFMGISAENIARYQLVCYFGAAAIVDDALGVLEGVAV